MIFLSVTLVLIAILVVVRMNALRAYKLPPTYPGWIPLIGHCLMLLGKNQEELWNLIIKLSRDCLRQGGAISVYFGTYAVVGISDPDDAITIANTCLEKHFVYDLAKPWLGECLGVSKVSTWKKHRKVLNLGFTHQALIGFLDVFSYEAKLLTKDLETKIGEPFSPDHVLLKNGLRTICKTAIGVEPEALPTLLDDYTALQCEYFDLATKNFLNICFPILFPATKKRFNDVIEKLQKFSSTLLRLRKAALFGTKEKKAEAADNMNPIMDVMLELQHKEKMFTDRDIQSELDLIFLAGHDTTATTLEYVLLLLGSHPEVQEKAFKEVQEVWSDPDRDLDSADLDRLVYMECIIKETIRLYPLTPLIARMSPTDVKLKNYTIPAGTALVICIWAMHRHSLWGEDPDAFRPERWLDPAKATDFSRAFFGLSAGRRGCIGKTYAMASMKIILAHIIGKYQIKSDISKLILKMNTLLKPKSGNEISIVLRK